MTSRLLFSAALLALAVAPSARAQINSPPPADAAAATPVPPAPAPSTPVAPPIAEEVTLFYAAETSGPVAKRLPAGHPGLAAARPHAEPAKAAAGWKFVELQENYVGFAPANTTRKDLTIRPGTPIRQLPGDASPPIGVAASAPPTMVEAIEGDWARVSLPAAVLVYFQEKGATAAVVATTPVPAAVVRPAPATPAPAVAPAAPIVAQHATPVPGAGAADLPRYYVGILKLRSNPTIAGPPTAKYLLLSSDNRLVALVDAENVLSPSPVATFINKPVRVYGLAEASKEFPAAVIKAQLIQPAL